MTSQRSKYSITVRSIHLAHRTQLICNEIKNCRFDWLLVGRRRRYIWCKIHVLNFQNEIRPLNPLSKTLKISGKTNWLKCCISFDFNSEQKLNDRQKLLNQYFDADRNDLNDFDVWQRDRMSNQVLQINWAFGSFFPSLSLSLHFGHFTINPFQATQNERTNKNCAR